MKDSLRTLPALLATLLAVALPAPAADVAVDPHDGIACSKCHLGSAARALAAADGSGADPRSATCRECHSHPARRAAAGARALGFHDDPRADCAGCHAFHERGRLKTSVGDVRTGDGGLAQGTAGHCAACHRKGAVLANLSPAHRTAAALYHRDAKRLAGTSPSRACLNCHADDSESPWKLATGQERLTFNEHATHPLGVAVSPGSGRDERSLCEVLDPRLPLFDGRIECQTCHSLTEATDDLLVPFEASYDLCLGCHKLRNPKPSEPPQALMATMLPVR